MDDEFLVLVAAHVGARDQLVRVVAVVQPAQRDVTRRIVRTHRIRAGLVPRRRAGGRGPDKNVQSAYAHGSVYTKVGFESVRSVFITKRVLWCRKHRYYYPRFDFVGSKRA